MNEILQKRIEEAAKEYSWSHDTIGIDKETFYTEASQKHPIPIHKEVRVPIQHEMEIAFKCAAHFILKNQWISVEEALPKTSNGFSKDVLCIDNRGCIIVAKYQDRVGWWSRGGTHWNTNGFTHWMLIPTLKGGEK